MISFLQERLIAVTTVTANKILNKCFIMNIKYKVNYFSTGIQIPRYPANEDTGVFVNSKLSDPSILCPLPKIVDAVENITMRSKMIGDKVILLLLPAQK